MAFFALILFFPFKNDKKTKMPNVRKKLQTPRMRKKWALV